MPDFNASGVVFKSGDRFFYAEKCGDKPNTLRTVTQREAERIFSAQTITICRAARPSEKFTHPISSVFDVTEFYKDAAGIGTILVICWEGDASA